MNVVNLQGQLIVLYSEVCCRVKLGVPLVGRLPLRPQIYREGDSKLGEFELWSEFFFLLHLLMQHTV